MADTESDRRAEYVAPGWWIGPDEQTPFLGPFASKDLALEVRLYVELVTKPTMLRVFEVQQSYGPDAPTCPHCGHKGGRFSDHEEAWRCIRCGKHIDGTLRTEEGGDQ